jgi:hypothetical protein
MIVYSCWVDNSGLEAYIYSPKLYIQHKEKLGYALIYPSNDTVTGIYFEIITP